MKGAHSKRSRWLVGSTNRRAQNDEVIEPPKRTRVAGEPGKLGEGPKKRPQSARQQRSTSEIRTAQQFNPMGFPASAISMHPAVPPKTSGGHVSQAPQYAPPRPPSAAPKPPPQKREGPKPITKGIEKMEPATARPASAPARRVSDQGAATDRPQAALPGGAARGYAAKALGKKPSSAAMRLTQDDSKPERPPPSESPEEMLVLLAGDGTRAGCMGLLQEHLITGEKNEQLARRRAEKAQAREAAPQDPAAEIAPLPGPRPLRAAYGAGKSRAAPDKARAPHATDVGPAHGQPAYLIYQPRQSVGGDRLLPGATAEGLAASLDPGLAKQPPSSTFTPHWWAKAGPAAPEAAVPKDREPVVDPAKEAKALEAAVRDALTEGTEHKHRLAQGRHALTEDQHIFQLKSPFKNAHSDQLRSAGMVDASGVPPDMKPPTPRVEVEVPRVLQQIRERQNKRSVGQLWRMMNTDNDQGIDKKEFEIGLAKMGFTLGQHEFDEIWNWIDVDGSGDIDFHELTMAMTDEGGLAANPYMNPNYDGRGAPFGRDTSDNNPTVGPEEAPATEAAASASDYMNLVLNHEAKEAKEEEARFFELTAEQFIMLMRQKSQARSSFKKYWHSLDTNHDGSLDKDEFLAILRRMSIKLVPGDEPRLWQFIDSNANKRIEFTEIVQRVFDAPTDGSQGPMPEPKQLFDTHLRAAAIKERRGNAEKDPVLQRQIADLQADLARMPGLVGVLYGFEDVGGSGFITREDFAAFVEGYVDYAIDAKHGARAQDKARPQVREEIDKELAGQLFDQLDTDNRGEVECVELAARIYAAVRYPPHYLKEAHKEANQKRPVGAFSYAKARAEARPVELYPETVTIADLEKASGSQGFDVLPSGKLQGRFISRPAETLRPGATSHMVEPSETNCPAYAEEAVRLDPRKGSIQIPEVERLEKKQAQIQGRHARMQAYREQELQKVNAAEEKAEIADRLRTEAMKKQKIKYLKSVAVAPDQQRPRRIAKSLEKKGLLW